MDIKTNEATLYLLILGGYLLGLIFRPEHWDNAFFPNVGGALQSRFAFQLAAAFNVNAAASSALER
jgi:hypothetical protein